MTPWPRSPLTQRAFVNSPRSLRSSGNLEVYPPMPMPLPLPDRVEIAEYLAKYVLRDIEVGGFTHDDLLDSPEVGCLEQVGGRAGPPARCGAVFDFARSRKGR